MTLHRITWKGTETHDDRRKCGDWLTARGWMLANWEIVNGRVSWTVKRRAG